MFQWLNKVWPSRWRRKLVSREDSTSASDIPTHSQRKAVIFCGPDYGDEATAIIGSWLEEVQVQEDVEKLLVTGKDVTRAAITDFLSQTKGANSVGIFAGHGSPDALLGPLYLDCASTTVNGVQFAILYNATSVANDKLGALFAFCCKSAQQLGVQFAQVHGRSFLGYLENIGYDLTNDECRKVWKNIIQLVSSEIVRDGTITQNHEDSLRNLYDDAIDYFMNGPGRNNDRNVETLIVLTKHKKFLRRYGGPPNVS